MGLFKKKRVESEEKTNELDLPEDASVRNKLERINANISKVNVQVESLNEVRKSTTERFAAMTEQMGEIRGQLMDATKSIGEIEVKATRAADLVDSVHPDKLLIEIQKEDGKIEALKANIESNEAMMHNLMDQLKKIRNMVSAFRGIEQVLKMNQEVKDEILNIKKIAATVERHSDKVETVFSDIQKTYHEYNMFEDSLKELKKEVGSLSSQVSQVNVKVGEFITKREFESRVNSMERFQNKASKTLDDVHDERKTMKKELDLLKKSLKLEFEKEITSARVMSHAFEKLLVKNPELAKKLKLRDYISKRKYEIDQDEAELSGENPTKQVEDSDSKEQANPELDKQKEGSDS
jgi:hypothetical protein